MVAGESEKAGGWECACVPGPGVGAPRRRGAAEGLRALGHGASLGLWARGCGAAGSQQVAPSTPDLTLRRAGEAWPHPALGSWLPGWAQPPHTFCSRSIQRGAGRSGHRRGPVREGRRQGVRLCPAPGRCALGAARAEKASQRAVAASSLSGSPRCRPRAGPGKEGGRANEGSWPRDWGGERCGRPLGLRRTGQREPSPPGLRLSHPLGRGESLHPCGPPGLRVQGLHFRPLFSGWKGNDGRGQPFPVQPLHPCFVTPALPRLAPAPGAAGRCQAGSHSPWPLPRCHSQALCRCPCSSLSPLSPVPPLSQTRKG